MRDMCRRCATAPGCTRPPRAPAASAPLPCSRRATVGPRCGIGRSGGRPAAAEAPLPSGAPDRVALPWPDGLAAWSPADIPFRDIPVGPSRHLVRFVHVGGRLWALKELPGWAAEREYTALLELERRALPAVRAAGLAVRPDSD